MTPLDPAGCHRPAVRSPHPWRMDMDMDMELLDQIERLGAAVETGEIRYEDAVRRLAEWGAW